MKIQVCMWKTCKWNFAEYISKRLKGDIKLYNLNWVIIEECMCMWKCKEWPNVTFDKKLESHMTPIKASKIMLDKKFKKKKKNNK